MRTTSSLESFNSVLGRSCPMHPHIFQFADYLRLHDSFVVIDMWNSIKFNQAAVSTRNQAQEEKLKNATEMLRSEKWSVAKFLEIMADKTIIPKTGMLNRNQTHFHEHELNKLVGV